MLRNIATLVNQLRQVLEMFNKGDFIVYGTTGVCEVMDITTINMSDVPKDKLYYVLRPYYQKGSKVFSPVENGKTVMRKVITKEEAISLIDDIPNIKEINVTNDKTRDDEYKEIIRSCQCREWIKIIKTSYTRRQERLGQGKKVTASDDRYLKMAKESLYSELALPLEIPKEEVEQYIQSRIENKEK